VNYKEILKTRNFWGSLQKAPGIKREAYLNKLIEESQNENISAMMGVRRSGKSTLLIQLIEELIRNKDVKTENTLFINFEDPRLIDLLSENKLIEFLNEFYIEADNRSTVYFFLDEIQNVENWQAIVRTIQDTLNKVKIYITGSSASLLGRELGTKLTGRYLSTEVFPLSFHESREFVADQHLKKFLEAGGFPNVVLTKSEEIQRQLLQDYFDSILLKDISTRYSIRNDFKLKRLAQFLFTNISNQASSYRLSKDLSLSPDTVLQYFKYIEDAYLGFFVPQYANSLRKQEYNPKKFYAIDTGLQSAVAFKVFDDNSKLFENIVFLELRRIYDDIYYWEEGKEVDFIVRKGEQTIKIINASYSIESEETLDREVESLQAAMYEFDHPESILVVAEGKRDEIITEVGVIEIIPFEEADLD
jgi:hypothetical protein